MNSVFKILMYVVLGAIALIIAFFAVIWVYHYYSPIEKSDNINILAMNKVKATYIYSNMVQSPDGSYYVVSSQHPPGKKGKVKESNISIIKLDKDLHQLWEKLIPGQIPSFHNDLYCDGKKLFFVSSSQSDKPQNPVIRTFSMEGDLLSTKVIKLHDLPGSNSRLRLKIVNDRVYACWHNPVSRKLYVNVSEVASGKSVAESDCGLVCDSLYISEPGYDAKDKSIYILSKRYRQKLYLHKFDSGNNLTKLLDTNTPETINSSLFIDDKLYISTTDKSVDTTNKPITNIYEYNNNKLTRLISYTPPNGKTEYTENFMKIDGYWYILFRNDTVEWNPDVEVHKIDSAGNLISETKIWTEDTEIPMQILLSQNRKIIIGGSTFAYRTRYGARPFVSMVNL